MKISLVHVPRRPPWPIWAVAVVMVWLVLVCAAVFVSSLNGRQVELCLFKYLTHIPCPTCGSTRGVLHLLHGRLFTAWLYNPLVFSAGLLYLGSIGMRMLFARAVRITLSQRERRIAWLIAAVLLLANWIYVIIRVG